MNVLERIEDEIKERESKRMRRKNIRKIKRKEGGYLFS